MCFETRRLAPFAHPPNVIILLPPSHRASCLLSIGANRIRLDRRAVPSGDVGPDSRATNQVASSSRYEMQSDKDAACIHPCLCSQDFPSESRFLWMAQMVESSLDSWKSSCCPVRSPGTSSQTLDSSQGSSLDHRSSSSGGNSSSGDQYPRFCSAH